MSNFLKTHLISLTYSIQSIRRNFRRSFTLMFGVIISLAIISGVLFYFDSTSESLVVDALEDVYIDTSFYYSNADTIYMRDLQNYILNDIQNDLVIGAEVIAGRNPFSPMQSGAIINSNGIDLTNTSMGDLRDSVGNYTQIYIFAVDPSYFNVFDIFTTTENVTNIFSSGDILVSSGAANYLGLNIGDNVSIEILSSEMNFQERELNIEKVNDVNLTMGGSLSFDYGVMDSSMYAFDPEYYDDTDNFFMRMVPPTEDCIVMSYDQYFEVFEGTNFHAVQLRIDHSMISADTSIASTQISSITSYIEVFYPEAEVLNLVEIALDDVADMLNQMRLFLIYFALPGIFLGIYISKYAIDLTIEERQREISVLRTKAALRQQIASIIGLESSIIVVIGMAIGLVIGYLTSLLILNVIGGKIDGITASTESILISIVIGAVIVIIAAYLSIRQLLASNVTESRRIGKEDEGPLWKRLYLDIVSLVIVFVIAILNIFDFNPIPGFAAAAYDFLAPLLTWIGLTLIMVRLLSKILLTLQTTILRVYYLFFKDLAPVITKNIIYRPQRISKIIIVLSLTLSFGLVISAINNSYIAGANRDALYQSGADIRIQFPSGDSLDYKTSEFIELFESEFEESIIETTSVYTGTISLGRTRITLIGIEPDSFFDVCMMEESFLQENSISDVQKSLQKFNIDLTYSNILLSNSIANPEQADMSSTRFGAGPPGGFQQSGTQVFSIGDTLEIRAGQFNMTNINDTMEITILDVVYHFPSISDLTGRSEDELTYAVANVDFLRDPGLENTTLLNSDNASVMFIDLADNGDNQILIEDIETWYESEFSGSDALDIVTPENFLDEYEALMTSLTGLTNMEFILVLTVSTLGLEIFLTSSLYNRKKEFGTYYAIGGRVSEIRKIILGELLLISGFTAVVGIGLSWIVSQMYIGFISDLLILEITVISIPLISILFLLLLLVISLAITMLLTGNRLAKLDPVNILRTV